MKGSPERGYIYGVTTMKDMQKLGRLVSFWLNTKRRGGGAKSNRERVVTDGISEF